MSLTSFIKEWFGILTPWQSREEKPDREEYARGLRCRLRKIQENCLDRDIDSCEADIVTPTLATVKEVAHALLDHRVTVAELEPEIRSFNDITIWLWHELREGRLSWEHLATREALTIGSLAVDCETFREIMRAARPFRQEPKPANAGGN